MTTTKDRITLNNGIVLFGERELWFDFVAQVKKDKKKVWDILEPMIKEYIRKGAKNETR